MRPITIVCLLLLLAACSVERVGTTEEELAADRTPDTRPEATPAPETAGGAPEAGGGGQAAPTPANDRQQPPDGGGAGSLTFGMPDFPGTVTGGNVATALAKACGTPEPCVDYEIRDEHSDDVPEGRYIRSDPPSGARVEPGDKVVVWRSLGPADPDGGDGDVTGAGSPDGGANGEGRGANGDGEPVEGAGGQGGGGGTEETREDPADPDDGNGQP